MIVRSTFAKRFIGALGVAGLVLTAAAVQADVAGAAPDVAESVAPPSGDAGSRPDGGGPAADLPADPAGSPVSNPGGDLERVPELITFVEAEYPPAELRAGVEGVVVLDLVINTQGTVDSVAVVDGVTPAMDAAAVAAARGFRFTPAVAGGEPVPVILQYEYSFSLREQAQRIGEYVNFAGSLREKGTRRPITEALVVVAFPDTAANRTLTVPWSAYLARLGEFGGQFQEDGRIITYTDSLGRFAFKSLPAGPVEVSFPNAGYEAARYTENLGAGERLEVEYWIERTSYDEYELVVYGKSERKEVTRQTLQLTEIAKIPGLSGDAIRVVQTLPGVARPSFVSGDVIVRGSSAEDTRFYLDGVDIPLLFHYGGLKSTYNSEALETIDLYPGGFNTRYGGCIGGVVEIKGRPGAEDRWHKSLDLNLLDATLLAEGPLSKRWSLSLTARRSYIGNALSLIKGLSDDLDMTVVPYYWDFVGRVDWRPNSRDRAFLTLFSVGDAMDLVFEDTEAGSEEIDAARDEFSMNYRFHRLILGFDKHLAPGLDNELRLSTGWDTYRGRFLGFESWDYHFQTYTVRDQIAWQPAQRLTYNVGLDLYRVPLHYEVHVAGSGDTELSPTFQDLGAYVNVEMRPNDRLRITPGVRYDRFREIDAGEPNYRLTVRYQLDRARLLKAAVGTYCQSPRPLAQAIDPEFGNPSLPATTARHYTAGAEWQLNELVSADANVYYNTQEQIPNMVDDPAVNFLPDMDARMYGLELMLRRAQGGRIFGWLSYSLSRSERRSPRKPDSGIRGDWDPDRWFVSGYDQTHHLQLVSSYVLGRNWQVGARVQYVTGNPDTPRLGHSGQEYEFNADTGEYVALLGDYQSERMGPFFQIDARVDKRWVFRRWVLTTYLDVQNLNYFFYNSPEMYAYSYDDTERKAIGGIVLPALGVRVDF
jgi:TonB family protein